MSPHENHIIYRDPTSVSSIKDVKPAESKHPRNLNIIFDSNDGIVDSTVEFDTDESAQDWRRELLGTSHPFFRQGPEVI